MVNAKDVYECSKRRYSKCSHKEYARELYSLGDKHYCDVSELLPAATMAKINKSRILRASSARSGNLGVFAPTYVEGGEADAVEAQCKSNADALHSACVGLSWTDYKASRRKYSIATGCPGSSRHLAGCPVSLYESAAESWDRNKTTPLDATGDESVLRNWTGIALGRGESATDTVDSSTNTLFSKSHGHLLQYACAIVDCIRAMRAPGSRLIVEHATPAGPLQAGVIDKIGKKLYAFRTSLVLSERLDVSADKQLGLQAQALLVDGTVMPSSIDTVSLCIIQPVLGYVASWSTAPSALAAHFDYSKHD